MDSQLALTENYEFRACCSFSYNVFSPYHVSGPVLGPGETAVQKADTVCPLRNELPDGNPGRKVVITTSGVMMGRVMMGNPASEQRRGISPRQGVDRHRGACLHGHWYRWNPALHGPWWHFSHWATPCPSQRSYQKHKWF